MKNKKNIYILVLSLVFFTVFTSVLINYFKDNKTKEQTEAIFTPVEISNIKTDLNNKTESIVKKEILKDENIKNISVDINVFNKSYSIKIQENGSVYDAMKSISDESFSFKSTNHAGLGYFIESINGVKGEPGKYWIYYVNGKEASVGVSNYILKDGDSILWKQE